MSKEAISKIREVLGEDSSKVESMLVEINSDYKEFQRTIDDQLETIGDRNTEGKTKKLKIREIQKQLDDANDEIETLKEGDTSGEVKTLKEKLKVYDDAKTEGIKTKAKGFIDKYGTLKDHTDWKTCSANFNLPNPIKDDKEGKLDWESMDDNDIAKNADKLTEYIGIGKLTEINPNSEDRSQSRSKDKDSGVFKDEDFE